MVGSIDTLVYWVFNFRSDIDRKRGKGFTLNFSRPNSFPLLIKDLTFRHLYNSLSVGETQGRLPWVKRLGVEIDELVNSKPH